MPPSSCLLDPLSLLVPTVHPWTHFVPVFSWTIALPRRGAHMHVHTHTRTAKSGNAPCHTYLTFNTNASTDVIVHFHSTKLYVNPRVHFGTSSGAANYTNIVIASSHKVDIEVSRYVYYGFLHSLTPDTTYYFTVGDGDVVTGDTFIAEKKFRTAPVVGDFNWITGGDIGAQPASVTLMTNAANKEPLFMAIGGDLAYANGIRACYQRWDKFLSNLESSAVTPLGYTVPFVMAPGNHEAGGWGQPAKNMRFYNRYFVHENLAGRAASALPLHHVHYIANQVLIALDSNVVETPASQVNWLRNVMQSANNGSVKMAMYHAPGYPSFRPLSDPQSTGVRTYFVPVFEENGLTIGFENHDHAYKRTKLLLGGVANPSGILYVGDGAMGVDARPAIPTGRDYLNVSFGKQFYINAQMSAADNGVILHMHDINDNMFDNYVMNYR